MNTFIKNINGNWYAFATKSNQVVSIGGDCYQNTQYFAPHNDFGINYVAKKCPSRSAAYRKAYRYGTYKGEIKS